MQKNNERLEVRMPPAQRQALAELSAETGLSAAAVVRLALKKVVAERRLQVLARPDAAREAIR